jgi:hypothetical protein
MQRGTSALAAILLAACGVGGSPAGVAAPSGPPGPTGPTGGGAGDPAAEVVVAAGHAGDLAVEVRSDRPLGTGLTSLQVHLRTADGAAVPDATVTLGAYRPSSGARGPLVRPPTPDTEGVHRAEMLLTEPGPGWSLDVMVDRPGGSRSQATFPALEVVDRHLGGRFREGSTTWLLGARFEQALRAGTNPVTVGIVSSDDGGTTFAPVADATLAVEPYMPSMGHGASGSEAPVAGAVPGIYAGSVAFSMPGDWEATFTVWRGGVEAGRVTVAVWF